MSLHNINRRRARFRCKLHDLMDLDFKHSLLHALKTLSLFPRLFGPLNQGNRVQKVENNVHFAWGRRTHCLVNVILWQ